MEKVTRSPLSFLQNFGDTQPIVEEEEMIPISLETSRSNHKHPYGCSSHHGKKTKNIKKRCEYVILTDQLHEWNNFLHQKFKRRS
ncbi:unnamed protein product [Paramecium sonneborni]|uniref:Uncharacterized protein n=1 Tax=Paramecium sonneborni TaxID=65129 RepID=A0A8S1P2S6_9CILI|nr:unnamed protein product [Paramecium sonneborni]